jgi:glycerol-3-phosphate acyltransferase PlsX
MGSPPTAEARIAVDAMSGDLGPVEVVAAVKLARASLPQLPPITLVGDASVLERHLSQEQLVSDDRLQLLHASSSR